MTISKTFPAGYWQISQVVNGTLLSRVYVGFSRAEAKKVFAEYVKDFKKSLTK
jgi:hypothetical protein